MPFYRTYYHLIWATKRRKHLITPQLEKHLFAHIVQKASELGMYIFAVNGWTDHMHVVSSIPPKLAVSDAVGNLKGSSSHFVTNHALIEEDFAWQRGYGALTLGYTQLERAIAYVENQKQHHTKQQNLNKWLEHIADIDDGPANSTTQYTADSMILREDSAEYIIDPDTDWLFP